MNTCSLALSSSLRCIDSFWFACWITSQSSWTLNISQPSFLLRPGQTWGVGKFSFYFLFSSLAARQCGKVMFLQKFDKLPPKFYFQLSLIPMGSLSRGMESSMTTGSYGVDFNWLSLPWTSSSFVGSFSVQKTERLKILTLITSVWTFGVSDQDSRKPPPRSLSARGSSYTTW